MTVWLPRRKGVRRGAFRPQFMSKTPFADEMTGEERDALEANRLNRGLCSKCGRPMSVSAITATDAQMLCGCGFRACVKRGSRAYRAAALFVEMRGR